MNLAKVVAVHPESHSVDLLVLDDGRRMPGVRVMSWSASSNSGLAALPTPDSQGYADPYDAPFNAKRDIVACVAYYRDRPVVQGFLFPQVTQCLFGDLDRYMNRTASDAYWTVDAQANAEFYHPSGAFIRIAASPAHEDLTGKDFNKSWSISRNTGSAVHIHVEQAGGVASVDIAPSGDTVVKAPTVLVDSPESTFTGNVTVQKRLTYQGGMAGSNNQGGPTATIDGGMDITNGDVVVDGIAVKGHHHDEHDGPPTSLAKP